MRRFISLDATKLSDAKSKILLNSPYWIAAAITAVVSAAYTKLFSLSEEFAQSFSHTDWIYLLAPLALLLSFLLGHFFSKEAIGSGIPQIIVASDNEKSPLTERLLSIKTVLIKICGSCLAVLGGGSSGREGPTLHVAAGVFYQVSKFWPKRWPQPNLNFMIIAGAAAGLAAAFNTPLGGVVFAIEEIAKTHVSKIRTTVFQAVIIAGIISQLFFGNYLYLGSQEFFLVSSYLLVLQSIFLSLIIGFVGAVFAELLFKVIQWRTKLNFTGKLSATLLFAFSFAALIYICGPQSMGGGKTVMLELLKHPDAPINPLLPIGRILGNFFTYVSGVIGGIFAPSLASGAALSQWLGTELGFYSLRTMMLVGMVAFLNAVTRSPFTSFILVLEMTNSHEVVLYLMIAAIVSTISARLVSLHGFYEKTAQDIKESNSLV